MTDPYSASVLVRSFYDPADGAALKSCELILLLLERTSAPFSRRQFTPGHITASGLVISPDGGRILLVHHRRLDRFLLPGGHVEDEDASVAETARREVVEETGALLRSDSVPALVSLDVHGIPPRKGEPYHLHHDLTFAFHASANEVRPNAEARSVVWCDPAEFDRYGLPNNIRRAWLRVCGQRNG
jgi:8-oxo-dGTP pyrophosphatase MutT (NUDIX family)